VAWGLGIYERQAPGHAGIANDGIVAEVNANPADPQTSASRISPRKLSDPKRAKRATIIPDATSETRRGTRIQLGDLVAEVKMSAGSAGPLGPRGRRACLVSGRPQEKLILVRDRAREASWLVAGRSIRGGQPRPVMALPNQRRPADTGESAAAGGSQDRLVVVADGHGGARHFRSASGAKLAGRADVLTEASLASTQRTAVNEHGSPRWRSRKLIVGG